MQSLSLRIASYLEMSEYEKQLSPDTIKAYRIDLQQFSCFTKGTWADKDMLSRYIKFLNQNFAPRSVKRKLASIRAFYREVELCGELEENPFDKLHFRIHSPQQLPRVIPEEIIRALLENAYDSYAPGNAKRSGISSSWSFCSALGFESQSCVGCRRTLFCWAAMS